MRVGADGDATAATTSTKRYPFILQAADEWITTSLSHPKIVGRVEGGTGRRVWLTSARIESISGVWHPWRFFLGLPRPGPVENTVQQSAMFTPGAATTPNIPLRAILVAPLPQRIYPCRFLFFSCFCRSIFICTHTYQYVRTFFSTSIKREAGEVEGGEGTSGLNVRNSWGPPS